MRATIDIPDALGAEALDRALEGLVSLGVSELEGGMHGRAFPALYASGVRYQREPAGSERWLTPSQVLELGEADCEDLAAYRVAELRVSGEDPAAVARAVRTGPRTWHAIVERGDGSVEDPSAILGMPSSELGSIPPLELSIQRDGRGGWVVRLSRGDQGVSGRADYAHDAIARAAELGVRAGELGIVPGLDVLARAARGAVDAVVPGLLPGGAPARAPARARRDDDDDAPGGDDVERIAARLRSLVQRETRRKVRDAERAASRARERAVKR